MAWRFIRHDAAHVLAQAVQELFPGTQVTIRPDVEDGFYYDFARKEPFSTDDFAKIEAKMKRDRRPRFADRARGLGKGDAIAHFKSHRRDYKAEIIDDIIPPGEAITLYRRATSGAIFAAGRTCRRRASWQGLQADEAGRRLLARRSPNNAQLQRIYGTAWARTRRTSNAYLHAPRRSREARPPQARPQMGLFHMQEEGRAWCSGTPRADAVAHAGGLHAPPAGRGGLCRSAHAAGAGPEVLGKVGPLGEVSREHVRLRDGGRRRRFR
jgi:threonyl-tRNA synthetase